MTFERKHPFINFSKQLHDLRKHFDAWRKSHKPRTRISDSLWDLAVQVAGQIHTAELVNANPFDYLTELQIHTDEVKSNPSHWMPWNYRETINQAQAEISNK
jgi:hypothetical protein